METRYTNIDGDEWSVNPFPATKGAGYLKRLFKVFGKSFSVLLEVGDVEGGITRAVELLTDNLDNEDVVSLIVELTKGVKKNGKEINFDLEFSARYDLLFKVVKFIVMENYGSFFPKSDTGNE